MHDFLIGERSRRRHRILYPCLAYREVYMLFSSKIRCQEEIAIYNAAYHCMLRPLVSCSTSVPGTSCAMASASYTPLPNSHPRPLAG